jgi:2-iminoacetate synthase
MEQVVREDEINRYLIDGKDFIDDDLFTRLINETEVDEARIHEIIKKSRNLERLDLDEVAQLIALPTGHALWDEIFQAAHDIKDSVYGNRIVTFAPLYVSNHCVNNCQYCGYRTENSAITRKRLSDDEIRAEVKALVEAGHKRLIMVYGEHPLSDYEYIAQTLKVAYAVKSGNGEIRRINVNAAPLSIKSLQVLRDVGIGTYQVFQESYDRKRYAEIHPTGLKANYRWRLYALHRSLEAGADDVGMGALFGVADWRFELLGLLAHTIDLEKRFGGVGPHTISFPRIEHAVNTPYIEQSPWRIDDQTFTKIVAIIRLMVPYTGMILTCREPAAIRERLLELGVTQLDFGSNIGVGAYSQAQEDHARQQFVLSDTRTLDEGIRWLATRGRITSFCTADYRLGRTGRQFMCIAKKGNIQHMCRPNAVLTFTEYLLDYASPETKAAGAALVERELEAIHPAELQKHARELLARIHAGERDLYI